VILRDFIAIQVDGMQRRFFAGEHCRSKKSHQSEKRESIAA
jgi:hypothetical protein